MALSGSYTNYFQGNASRFHMTTSWSATQNITNNTSTITAITTIRPEGAFAATASKNGSITIAGNRKDFTFVLGSVGAGVTKEVGRHTVTVSHAGNGTGSAAISSALDINITYSGLWLGSLSTSGTASLNTIPRTSSFTIPSSFNVGSAFTVSITRASTSFTHEISLHDGSTSLYWSGNNVATSGSPNIAANTLIARMSGVKSKVFTVRVDTFNGSTLIGTASKTITANIPASTFTAPSSFTVGSAFTASITRVSSSLTHRIELRDSSTSVYLTEASTSTSLSSNAPANTLIARMSGVKSKVFTVMLHTYNAGVWIANTSKTITANISVSDFTSPNDFTMGENFTVNITPNGSVLRHKVELLDGSTVLYASANSVTTSNAVSVTWATMGLTCTNAMSKNYVIRVTTYNGSTTIGSKTRSTKGWVPSNIKPSLEHVNAVETVTAVSSTINAFIQGKSRVKIMIENAKAGYGSWIRNYEITGYGINHSGSTSEATSSILYSAGTQTYTATVTDARGQTYTWTRVIEVLPYTPPTLSGLSFKRTLPDKTEAPLGDNATVSASVKVQSLIVNGVQKNSIKYQVQSTQSGGTFADKANTTSTSLTKSYSDVWVGYSVDHSYNFRVRVGDIFGWGGWSVGVVPTGIVTQQWGSKTTSFGKMIDDTSYNVQVGSGGIQSDGRITIDAATNSPRDNSLISLRRQDDTIAALFTYNDSDNSISFHRYSRDGTWTGRVGIKEDGTLFDRSGNDVVGTDSMFHKITTTTPAAAGWENAKVVTVPSQFSGKFEILDAKYKNPNNVWLDANTWVRPNNPRTAFSIEVPSGFTNFEIRIIIMKI